MQKPATRTAKLFNERTDFFTRQGLSGRALYEALAADSDLPSFFETEDVAAIMGLEIASLKRRRRVGEQPPFLRVGGKIVRYPKHGFCLMLADAYCGSAA